MVLTLRASITSPVKTNFADPTVPDPELELEVELEVVPELELEVELDVEPELELELEVVPELELEVVLELEVELVLELELELELVPQSVGQRQKSLKKEKRFVSPMTSYHASLGYIFP
jgi:hypothetical protein